MLKLRASTDIKTFCFFCTPRPRFELGSRPFPIRSCLFLVNRSYSLIELNFGMIWDNIIDKCQLRCHSRGPDSWPLNYRGWKPPAGFSHFLQPANFNILYSGWFKRLSPNQLSCGLNPEPENKRMVNPPEERREKNPKDNKRRRAG